MSPDLADAIDRLEAERLRPDTKPPTVEELLGDLIASLHRLYRTDPDEQETAA